jgi:hypothetical protein
MALYETVKQQLDTLIAEAKVAFADRKVTLSEVWAFTSKAIGAFVVVAAELQIDNVDKKLVVTAAAEKLYDEVIAPIDISAIPNMIEPAFDKIAKSVFLEVVSGVVDGIVSTINKVKDK